MYLIYHICILIRKFYFCTIALKMERTFWKQLFLILLYYSDAAIVFEAFIMSYKINFIILTLQTWSLCGRIEIEKLDEVGEFCKLEY